MAVAPRKRPYRTRLTGRLALSFNVLHPLTRDSSMKSFRRVPARSSAGGAFILEDASVDDLEVLLSGLEGFVWINQHMPHPTVSWWQSTVQLSAQTEPRQLTVRNVSFDVQMTVSDFLREIDSFRDGGIGLVLSDRPMPDTFGLERVLFEPGGDRALVQNGARLAFGLPHRWEYARLDAYTDDDARLMVERFPLCIG
jgi:hypothetical protein